MLIMPEDWETITESIFNMLENEHASGRNVDKIELMPSEYERLITKEILIPGVRRHFYRDCQFEDRAQLGFFYGKRNITIPIEVCT